MWRFNILAACLVLVAGCHSKPQKGTKNTAAAPECSKGLMTGAWYTFAADEKIPPITNLKEEFQILVDTCLKPVNFISCYESFERERSYKADTADINFREGWEKLSLKEKFKMLRQEKEDSRNYADSIHIVNNSKSLQVWIINNSKDSIGMQMQDGTYICVLQGKKKNGDWAPIQYWRFSNCGNSYYKKYLPSKKANSFVTNLPNKGDYRTHLRFKLLGADKFYYSNEFEGGIEYCEFVEDSSSYYRSWTEPQPHYKLDSFRLMTRW